MTKRRASRGSSRRSMPASQGRSSVGAASTGGLASGRMEPARTSTVRVPAPVSQARSTASRTVTPQRSRARTSSGSLSAAVMTTMTCESARAANAPRASASSGWLPQGDRSATGAGAAAGRDQATAEDDDARALPLLEPAGDVAAGGARAVGGLGRQQEVADDLDPAAEGHGERCGPVPGPVARALTTPMSTSLPIPRPSCHLRQGAAPPPMGGTRSPGRRSERR